ncbi:putative ribonuclease H-like domain-containing protein [Tanacetum coccineum]
MIAKSMTKLTQKKVKFDWGDKQEAAFHWNSLRGPEFTWEREDEMKRNEFLTFLFLHVLNVLGWKATVPPPYTGNYMPSKPDLSFDGLDDSVYKTKHHQPIRRPFNQKSAAKTNNFNEKVNTARVNNVTTAGPKAVVSAAVGNRENAVKSSTCWIWRPTGNVIDHNSKDSGSYMLKRFDYGNPQYTLQDQGIFDSGCSRHMTRNKSFLTDYQDIDGGFVAFARSAKGGKITGKGRKLALSFMRPFGCLVTILNTLDHLGYQTNGNAEDEVADDAGKKNGVLDPAKEDEKSGQGEATNTNSTNRLNTISSSINIVSSSFTTMDPGREKAQRNELESVFGQDKDANGNYIYRMFTPVNAAGSSCDNIGGSISVNAATLPNADIPTDPLMPDLEDTANLLNTGIFSGAYDDKDVGAEADFNNLEITMTVSPIPITIIHKDHPKNHIIEDINSATQTRRMTKISEEHAMMDVKSAFLYGTIEEEVYVCQPPGFEDPQFPDKVYKVEKALYSLHQAPRAWYETLSTYLLENGFRRGTIDKTLFIKKDKEFESLMHKKFQMSSMGQFTFFLGLQVMQRDDGIFISQDKSMIRSLMYLTASRPDIMFAVCAYARFQVTPKVSHLHAVKRIFRYLKGQPKLGLWYPRDSPFNLEAFTDSDYAGASLDKKSTTGGFQFIGKRLISWQCKKQTVVANSTTEAEYVAAANCCGQVLWIQNQMLDYGFNFMNTKIYIDNESTICIVKNPVFHSKTKHIEIRFL